MNMIPLNKTLFFSQTCEYLNVYLPKQAGKSERTIKTYKDALTVFRRYLTKEQGISIRIFKFEDCTRDLLLEYLSFLAMEHKAPHAIIGWLPLRHTYGTWQTAKSLCSQLH